MVLCIARLLLQSPNYKVFLLCSTITLSGYLLLITFDGTTSNVFHLFFIFLIAKHFVYTITFCYALHIWNAINFGHIFSSPTFHYIYWNTVWFSYVLFWLIIFKTSRNIFIKFTRNSVIYIYIYNLFIIYLYIIQFHG